MLLYMGGVQLEQVENFKYFGVILDSTLKFEAHMEYVYKKSSQNLGAIHGLREILNQDTALLLYKSIVLPHITHCDTVYMCATQMSLKKLQLLQNLARSTILLTDHLAHIADLHRDLDLK